MIGTAGSGPWVSVDWCSVRVVLRLADPWAATDEDGVCANGAYDESWLREMYARGSGVYQALCGIAFPA